MFLRSNDKQTQRHSEAEVCLGLLEMRVLVYIEVGAGLLLEMLQDHSLLVSFTPK
jgi:hypothetical protein